MLGAFGPSISAIIITAKLQGRTGVRELFRKLFLWRVGVRWYLIAFFVAPVLVGIGLAIYALMGGKTGDMSISALPLALIFFVSAIPTGALGEELGWRGFLLPQLRKKGGAAVASLIVGVVWFSWHIPLFWGPTGTTVSGQPVTLQAVAGYFCFVISISFIFTWLCENTNGSVLLAILLHASLNAGIPFLFFPDIALPAGGSPSEALRAATHLAIIPIGIAIALILIKYGTNRFSITDARSPWIPEARRHKVYGWYMSRTNIDIDDQACAEVMRRYRFTTKKEAVNFALKVLAAEPLNLEEAMSLRGSGWEGGLDELRSTRSARSW